MSNEDLYSWLRFKGGKGHHATVMDILKILIKDRREKPNLAMYSALLHSYASSKWGTAGKIRKTLDEMAAVGIELDARACEYVLEALAVHPDSFLRTDILEYMKARWWSPTPRAQGFIVAGLLRERCFEMALERLETMVKENVPIDPWLWDKTIWMLLEYGEVDEAFHVLSLRRHVSNVDSAVSETLWTQLLDVAGKKHIVSSCITSVGVVPGLDEPN